MASKIQIARGNITAFKDALKQGELFFQIRNLTDDYSRSPHEEGIVYIGDPKATGNSEPVAIAAVRTIKANVYRGDLGSTLSSQDFNIKQEKFKYVRPGDYWIWQNRADALQKIVGEEIDYAFMRDDFRKGDILLIIDCDVDEKTGIAYNIEYRRVMTGSCDARDVYYYIYDKDGNIDTDINIDNVNDVLKFLERYKLQYKGVIDDQWQLEDLRTDNGKVTRGSIWLVLKDDLDWPNIDAMLAQPHGRVPKRGDFVYYENERCTYKGLDTYPAWKIIPCADSDAEDIDYLQYDRQKKDLYNKMNNVGRLEGADHGTFHLDHIENAILSSDVRKALDFLMINKAQLDASGKVPLSQLHATVLGALQYKGVWNPINNINGVTDPQYQNPTPSFPTGKDEYGNPQSGPSNGDYYQVKIDLEDGSAPINIQFQDPYDPTRVLELNNGDFIVWQASDDQDNDFGGGRWEVIDNTDRLTSLDFTINGHIVDKDALLRDDPYDVSLVQSPHLKADYKLCLHQTGNQVTICGVRLVDQEILDDGTVVDGKPMFIPKYSDLSRNTLTNTDIKNYLKVRTLDYVFPRDTGLVYDKAQTFQPSNNTTSDNSNLAVNPRENTKIAHNEFGLTIQNSEVYIPVSVGSEVTIHAKPAAEGRELVIEGTTDEITDNGDGTFTFTSSLDGYEKITVIDGTIDQITVDDYDEKVTEFGSNVYIGQFNESHTLTTYGDISLSAYLKNIGAGAANPVLNFFIRSDADTRHVDATKVTVKANDEKTESDIVLTLPEKTSTIIAKLPDVIFAKDHLLKSTVDGYAESVQSLEEKTDDEGNPYIYNNSYFETENINVHTVSFGYFDHGKFIKTITVKGPEKVTNETFLIHHGGTAFTLEEYLKFCGQGTDGTVPVFKEIEDEKTGEKVIGIVDSKIKQVRHSIYETLKNNLREKLYEDQYDENGNVHQVDVSDEYLKERYGVNQDASVFENDVIIGEVEEAADGTFKIKTPRSLHVSNSLAVGNAEGASMHIVPDHKVYGFEIPAILEGEQFEDTDIIVERPLKSGMMLTHNSPISGGLWL